jgi:tripartite-type tricarboxylate transporter receptor subunit TctC
VVPQATPRPIVDRLSAELTKVLASADVIDRMKALGAEAAPPASPEMFEQFLKDDVARWKKIVTDAAIEVD